MGEVSRIGGYSRGFVRRMMFSAAGRRAPLAGFPHAPLRPYANEVDIVKRAAKLRP